MLSDDAKNRVLNELAFMAFTGNLNPGDIEESVSQGDVVQEDDDSLDNPELEPETV